MARQKNDIFTKEKFAKVLLIYITLFEIGNQILFFKNEKEIDKAKGKPAEPKGDYFIDKMKTINNNYKDSIEEDILHLSDFGHILAMSKDFVFNGCKNCGGQIIGHEKEEKDCKKSGWIMR